VAIYENSSSISKDEQQNFVINGKKDEVVGMITTCISREIRSHTSRINRPNVV
jgi:hypothetical protein